MRWLKEILICVSGYLTNYEQFLVQ